ncbi:MAG: RNA polymerase sigma factor [Candidatus Dormibacteraceae bacterium]
MDRDAEMHAAIIAGEDEALAEFEQRYRRPFIARGTGKGLSPEEAEDAFQEVFFSTVQRAGTLEGPLGLSLRKYASRAMGYRIAEHFRRPAEESLDEIDDTDTRPIPMAGSSSESAVNNRLRDAVRRCLDDLSETYRAILEAIVVGQMAPNTVAETLGLPRNTIYQAKGRALKRIRPCLEEAVHAAG